MVKKAFVSIILLFFIMPFAYGEAVKSGFVDYQESGGQRKESLLVLPLDPSYFNSYKSSYSSILNTISGDIVTATNKTAKLKALPLYSLNSKIKQNRLEPDFKKVVNTYQSKSIVDYKSLKTMCDVLHTDKVILVSGDFDSFKFIITPHSQKSLDLTEPKMIKPAYQINTLILLVDPQEEAILWEDIYKKNFTVNSPQLDFEHNAITVSSLRRFSQTTANSVLHNVNMVLVQPDVMTTEAVNSINTGIQPTDGVTTKDGHSFSAVNKFVKAQKRKYSERDDDNL